MNDTHRKRRLKELIEVHFGGSRQRFMDATDYSPSRLSQLLGSKAQFGEKAAQEVMDRLHNLTYIDPNWFQLAQGTRRRLTTAER